MRHAQRRSSAQKQFEVQELVPGTTYEHELLPGVEHLAPLTGLLAGQPGVQGADLRYQRPPLQLPYVMLPQPLSHVQLGEPVQAEPSAGAAVGQVDGGGGGQSAG